MTAVSKIASAKGQVLPRGLASDYRNQRVPDARRARRNNSGAGSIGADAFDRPDPYSAR